MRNYRCFLLLPLLLVLVPAMLCAQQRSERVENWFGFNIRGNDAGTAGDAVGTLFRNFGESNSAGASMGSYKDVLMLTPPAGGYSYDSHVLTYRAPIDGIYTLSVWAYVDADSDAPVIHFNKTEWDSRTVAGNETPVALRRWVEIKTTVPAELDEDNYFGLIAGATWAVPGDFDSDGLKNKVIYLRDPKLEVASARGKITLVDSNPTAAAGTVKTTPEELFLFTKGSAQLVLSGGIASGSPVWSSSDPSVAAVDQKGMVTAGWKGGIATITVSAVTAAAGIKTAGTKVTVTPKYIALTFDDGPDPAVTPMLLDYFTGPGKLVNGDGTDIHLSFFLVGARVANSTAQKNLVKRMIDEGHDVGSHTWGHEPSWFNEDESGFSPRTLLEYKANLFKTQLELWNIIKDVNPYPVGRALRFVRPAYLNSIDNFYTAAESLGLPTVGGTLLNDWEATATTQIVRDTAVAGARPWGFLVFHDYYRGAPQIIEMGSTLTGNGLKSIPAIPLVIEKLKADGYKFVSVSEMIKLKNVWMNPENEMVSSLSNLVAAGWEPAPVKTITYSPASVSLTKTAAAATVTATAVRDSADYDTAEVYWYSKDSSIATVELVSFNDSTGLSTARISARAGGITQVYCMSEGMMKEITVTVAGDFNR